MNVTDLVNADLHDDVESVVTTNAAVAEDTTVAVNEDATEVTTPVVQTAPKVRSRAGRKVDTVGKTALGAARLLYAANPTLGTSELRELFIKELSPRFGTTKQVAQTYVSYVRKSA